MARKYAESGITFEWEFGYGSGNVVTTNLVVDWWDFVNGLVIDTQQEYRPLSPKRSRPAAGYRERNGHCSGDIDTRHVATYYQSPAGWEIITHPHGRSSGSVRYGIAETEEEAMRYLEGYVNRRFKRLNVDLQQCDGASREEIQEARKAFGYTEV